MEKYFVRIYSAHEFVFPELGNLDQSINIIDSNVHDGMCEGFYSLGGIERKFSKINNILQKLLRDNNAVYRC